MTETHELTCRELVELVTEFLDGALSAAEEARFTDHLGRCTGCRNHLDQMRRTVALLGRLAEDDVPTDARDALLAAFRDWKQR